MATDPAPTREGVEEYARRAGLTRLTPEQLEEFVRAATYMRDLMERLPRDFAVTDEPAHIFRAGGEV